MEAQIRALKLYKSDILKSEGKVLSPEKTGMYNGIETALALLENRPAFHINCKREHRKEDMQRHPEHFL